MQARVQKWGNSLAVRIPKSFAAESQITDGSIVDMTLQHGGVMIVPVTRPKLTLAQLLEGVTDDNIHGEVDTGGVVGKEIW